MKTPIWETSPGATDLVMFNTTRRYVEADLYTINCTTGPVLRYTNCTRDVAYNPGTGLLSYSSKLVRIDDTTAKATGHWKTGLDVDTWQVPVYPRVFDPISGAQTFPDKIGSIPFVQAVHGGFLDGAVVFVDRAIFEAFSSPPMPYESPAGIYRMFAGTIAAVDMADPAVILNINSFLDRMTMQMPYRLYQAPCPWTLYDINCTLSAASFSRTGSVGIGSTNGIIVTPVAAPPGSGTYALGRVTITSGLNNGFSRMIRAWDGASLTLSAPFYFDLQVGDTFTAYAGCDKRQTTCALFNNINFGGEPYIPAPETAI